MTEGQSDTLKSFIDVVRQTLKETNSKTTNEYAFKSFLSFMSSRNTGDITKDVLNCWIATLFLFGKTAATVKRYVCKLHVAYLEWMKDSEKESQQDPFEGLLSLAVSDNEVRSEEADWNLGLIGKLISEDTYKGDTGKWNAVFFYLLYNPDISAEEAANLVFGETPTYCPQTVEIVEAMDRSKGRKYVFPLDQPDKRVTGVVNDIKGHVGRLTEAVGMKHAKGFAREQITAMWICAARKSGVRVEDIRAVISVVPPEYKILKSVSLSHISEKDMQNVICRVANRINDITTRWYVVNMRDKISPDNVKKTVKEKFPMLYERMFFFYPTHYIYRENRKKKKVKVEVPFIPGLLFVKVKSDMVGRVMRSIRNEAWGYKYLNTPDSPYSVISQRAMSDFQRHIGQFTDDIRMEIVTEKEPFAVNDLVTVYGDSIDGSVGEITEIKEKDGAKTYSIKLTHDKSFNWTVKISDEMRLEPISATQKQALENNG